MSLCEVRIPTYKRPALLKRALSSLIAQSYENWKGIVLDDSPEQEAKVVVESFNDNRIIYKPHPINFGQAKNLDYSFFSASYIDGLYAFVLEDDNYLFPDYIYENVKSLDTNKVNIVLRNQEIRIQKNGVSIPTNTTTRDKWFSQREYSPFEVYARLFFCEGISNGGLFWRTDKIQSNLQVGYQVSDPLHQELFRTLQIREPVYFEQTPLCVFTLFDKSEYQQNTSYIQRRINLVKYRRGVQSILLYLIRNYGASIVQEAQKIASEQKVELLLENKLLEGLYFHYDFTNVSKIKAMNLVLRHWIRYLTITDPYSNILTIQGLSS